MILDIRRLKNEFYLWLDFSASIYIKKVNKYKFEELLNSAGLTTIYIYKKVHEISVATFYSCVTSASQFNHIRTIIKTIRLNLDHVHRQLINNDQPTFYSKWCFITNLFHNIFALLAKVPDTYKTLHAQLENEAKRNIYNIILTIKQNKIGLIKMIKILDKKKGLIYKKFKSLSTRN